MSWQCPICETVNQDVTPVCTVCDHLAPVVDSYLSLESIENLRIYNEKLEEVHSLEIDNNFSGMLDAAIQAMALYRENGLAIEKAKQAIKKFYAKDMEGKLLVLLQDACKKKNLILANGMLKIIECLDISNEEVDKLRKDTKKKISRKKDVDQLLENSYQALLELDTSKAMAIVEGGLIIHTSSKRLQTRRTEIQTFIKNLNNLKDKKNKLTPSRPKPKPKPQSMNSENERHSIKQTEITGLEEKRKFPTVKRNN